MVKEACTIKYGGHEGQLSKQYWAMDRYRIWALEKLMLCFKLSKIQKMEMLKVLIIKIKIIIKGAENRKNTKLLRIYKNKKLYWEKKYSH